MDLAKSKSKRSGKCGAHCINSLELVVSLSVFWTVQRGQGDCSEKM